MIGLMPPLPSIVNKTLMIELRTTLMIGLMVAGPKEVADQKMTGNMNAPQIVAASLILMKRCQSLRIPSLVTVAALNLRKTADHLERRRARRAKRSKLENHVHRVFA